MPNIPQLRFGIYGLWQPMSDMNQWEFNPGGCYWDYYPGALSQGQVTVTYLMIKYPYNGI